MDLSFGAPLGFVAQGKDIGNIIQSAQDLFIDTNVMVNLPGWVKIHADPVYLEISGTETNRLEEPGGIAGCDV
jgi:hypothetical protein